MAEEKDEEQIGKQDQPTGEQSQQPPTGEQSQQQPTGQQGQSASGQTDLGQGGDTATLSGEQRGFGAGASGTGGSQSPGGTGSSQGGSGGFVGSQGGGSSEHVQEEGSTGESDFAPQGQGALEDEDIETGQPQSRDSDTEGSSGNV